MSSQTVGYFTGAVNGHLTGCAAIDGRSSYRSMLSEVLARIEERLLAVKLSATAASKNAGLSEDAIRNMRRAVERDERQGVSTATIFALAPVLKTSPSWLIEGVGPGDTPLSQIVGYAGADDAGELIQSDSDPVNEFAPMPPGGTSKSVAVHLKGKSMRGIADDGALIYFEHQQTPPTPDMIGEPCIVELEDGRVLFKRLQRGSRPNHYNLESTAGETIRDVRLKWAAEPTAIIPPRQARRIVRSDLEAP